MGEGEGTAHSISSCPFLFSCFPFGPLHLFNFPQPLPVCQTQKPGEREMTASYLPATTFLVFVFSPSRLTPVALSSPSSFLSAFLHSLSVFTFFLYLIPPSVFSCCLLSLNPPLLLGSTHPQNGLKPQTHSHTEGGREGEREGERERETTHACAHT